MSVAADLAPLQLDDDDGVPVLLADLWKEQAVVLMFVRHFGCVFCREQVNQFKKYAPRIHALGAALVVIGNGEERFARAFREELALPAYVRVLVDPGLVAYRAAGLRRGLVATLSPKLVMNAMRAHKNGYRQRALQGDPWQQGGVFVIAEGGHERFAYVSPTSGEYADVAAVLEALTTHAPRARRADDSDAAE